jgi:predicted TIM-barrel fold metal-dependent hydrolase
VKNGFRVIDGDGHMMEPLDIWTNYVEPSYRERAPAVIGAVGRTLHCYGPCEAFPEGLPQPRPESAFAGVAERYGEAYDTWWSLDSRLADMDVEGIDIMVCFPTSGVIATIWNYRDADVQAAMCRAYNNWATDYCAPSRGRVKFVAQVTALDPSAAVSEVRRIGDRLEVAGVVLPFRGLDQDWGDRSYDPLWSALGESHLAVCLHGGTTQFSLFRDWTMAGGYRAIVSHAMSFPFDSMICIGAIILGGVTERFPDLRLGAYEANAGWAPWWISRLDDHVVGRHQDFMEGNLRLPPSDYFRRQCFVSADADEATLPSAAEFTGGENIIFNSDYPHPDSAFPNAVDRFLGSSLSQEAKRKILWDNSVSLYRERVARS